MLINNLTNNFVRVRIRPRVVRRGKTGRAAVNCGSQPEGCALWAIRRAAGLVWIPSAIMP